MSRIAGLWLAFAGLVLIGGAAFARTEVEAIKFMGAALFLMLVALLVEMRAGNKSLAALNERTQQRRDAQQGKR